MTEQICKVLAFMAWAVVTILITGIPVVIGVAALVTLWRWFGV